MGIFGNMTLQEQLDAEARIEVLAARRAAIDAETKAIDAETKAIKNNLLWQAPKYDNLRRNKYFNGNRIIRIAPFVERLRAAGKKVGDVVDTSTHIWEYLPDNTRLLAVVASCNKIPLSHEAPQGDTLRCEEWEWGEDNPIPQWWLTLLPDAS